MKDLMLTEDWYKSLVDDCQAIITKAVLSSNWSLVEGYHELGERIREDLHLKKFSKSNLYSSQDLADSLGISERTLNYACTFYDKYPRLDKVPEGRAITWNKLITQYLTTPREKEKTTSESEEGELTKIEREEDLRGTIEYIICPTCHGTGRIKNETNN